MSLEEGTRVLGVIGVGQMAEAPAVGCGDTECRSRHASVVGLVTCLHRNQVYGDHVDHDRGRVDGGRDRDGHDLDRGNLEPGHADRDCDRAGQDCDHAGRVHNHADRDWADGDDGDDGGRQATAIPPHPLVYDKSENLLHVGDRASLEDSSDGAHDQVVTLYDGAWDDAYDARDATLSHRPALTVTNVALEVRSV